MLIIFNRVISTVILLFQSYILYFAQYGNNWILLVNKHYLYTFWQTQYKYSKKST